MDMSSLEQLLHNICLLLTCRTREVVGASLAFIKVILFILDVKVLASHVTVIVSIEAKYVISVSIFLFFCPVLVLLEDIWLK